MTVLLSAALGMAAPAAIDSTLTTSGKIDSAASETHQLFNVRNGSPNPVMQSALGDEAFSSVTLSGSSGYLTLSSHGCAGPPLNPPLPAGDGTAVSHVLYTEQFTITSTTLMPGDPVSIDVALAAGRRVISTIDAQPFLSESASASGDASVNFMSSTNADFSGTFGWQKEFGNENSMPSSTGIFGSPPMDPAKDMDPQFGKFAATIQGFVGMTFTISIIADLGAGGSTGNPHLADGDGQMSLKWGADVEGGLATLTSTFDNQPAPPTTGVDIPSVQALLPDRPFGLPEPASFALLGAAVALLASRRVRRLR